MLFLRYPTLIGIPFRNRIRRISPLCGRSSFKKFCLHLKDGSRRLLVVRNNTEDHNMILKEAEWLNFCAKHDIRTNQLLDHGYCNNGKNIFQLFTWVPGKDMRQLPARANKQIVQLCGRSAGRLLQKIHSLPSERTVICDLREKTEACIRYFSEHPELLTPYPDADVFLEFLIQNPDRTERRVPSVHLHGDYHAANLIYDGSHIGVIDWVYGKEGDPFEDLVRNLVNAKIDREFAAALVDSYFGGIIPDELWHILAAYTAIHALELCTYKSMSRSFVVQQHRLMLEQYHGMKNTVPQYAEYIKQRRN